MRCNICDRLLGEKEIHLDEDLKTEPCGECLEIIYDTAYPSGYDPDDDAFVLIEQEENVGDEYRKDYYSE